VAKCLLALVSASWSVAVDLTPASQRPFVGSSRGNSAVNLALGYNGLNRLSLPLAPPAPATASRSGVG
jgi:hypothetical protein